MEMQAFQHKIYLKPYLTEEKEVKRMERCIYMIDGSHGWDDRQLRFKSLDDWIHVDESWFYLMEDGTSLLRVPEIEVAANPKIMHKSHVEKIMFLSVLLNVNDLGFFASLKSECRDMETYVLERDRMMDIVMIKFQEYCSKKLERIWACLFNNFRSIMKVRGKNDYRQAHNDGRKRQNRGESPIDLTVDKDDYNECKRLIARFRARNPA